MRSVNVPDEGEYLNEKIRINKYLSASGVMSRREADRFIMSGKILVNGSPAEPGMKVDGTEDILIDGKPLDKSPGSVKRIVIAYYKKRGIVTSTVDQGREKNNIIDALNYRERVFPIGRLDKDSEGLILLTNDGNLVNRLLKGKGGHEKEYLVSLDKAITDEDISLMSKGGIELIPGRRSRPCKIKRQAFDKTGCMIDIILTEGMNREIRRMAEFFGYRVMKLKRIRFINVTLDGLKPGEYRELTDSEIESLL